MSIFGAALITFFAMFAMTWHLSRSTCQRIAGYALLVDITVHGTVLWLFLGKSTLGLMQAELSAIFVTLAIRGYRYLYGYQRLHGTTWMLYPGMLR